VSRQCLGVFPRACWRVDGRRSRRHGPSRLPLRRTRLCSGRPAAGGNAERQRRVQRAPRGIDGEVRIRIRPGQPPSVPCAVTGFGAIRPKPNFRHGLIGVLSGLRLYCGAEWVAASKRGFAGPRGRTRWPSAKPGPFSLRLEVRISEIC
jgi:hypothetical protein